MDNNEIKMFWFLIGGQDHVSCVAIGGRGGCGRSQRSGQPMLGESELPGGEQREQHDGKNDP